MTESNGEIVEENLFKNRSTIIEGKAEEVKDDTEK